MHKSIIGLIAAGAVALTGCSSTCDNFASTGDDLIEKGQRLAQTGGPREASVRRMARQRW
jgi:PBP1b-binding outer membrane lipoprotein LpoB